VHCGAPQNTIVNAMKRALVALGIKCCGREERVVLGREEASSHYNYLLPEGEGLDPHIGSLPALGIKCCGRDPICGSRPSPSGSR
jgi:hypothetical protein